MEKNTIENKVLKLLKLAGNNPSQEEAKAAFLKAQELMLKYHVDNPETIDEGEVIDSVYELGSRRKTEFVLMIAVVVAGNFRSKTAHYMQQIHFVGFRADAQAAREVFAFLLHVGDLGHDEYFADKHLDVQSDRNWRYGFIVGIHNAFQSRKGFELMTRVPDKVLDVYQSKHPKKTPSPDPGANIRSLDGSFSDGYRKGRESLDGREIENKEPNEKEECK